MLEALLLRTPLGPGVVAAQIRP